MSKIFERFQEADHEHRFSRPRQAMPEDSTGIAREEAGPKTNGHARGEVLRLVHTLFLSGGTNSPRQVLFCGVGEGNVSARVCAQAGEVLASEVPLPVCVVDAKVHAPSLHRFFHANGAYEYRGNGSGRLYARQIGDNLWLISPGGLHLNGSSGCGAEPLRSRLQELRKEFAYVLIDAEPVGQQTDAAVLGQATDGVVLVLDANATRRVAALSAKEAFEAAGVRLLGTVLNNRTFPIPENLYRKL